MKTIQYNEIGLLNQRRYRDKITDRDERLMPISEEQSCEQKLRIFYEWVVYLRILVERDFQA
ncbi:MAG: hypothetical protein JSV97_04370 [candidate division WOR-3 bacterium]|nr:MAG: hypothetical protein JSV97_04370 [candidate division WOR-3 bacterium]